MKELTPQILAMYLGCRITNLHNETARLLGVCESEVEPGTWIVIAQMERDPCTDSERNSGNHFYEGPQQEFYLSDIKPILRRLSSMSEEERREWEVIYLQMPMNTREDCFRIDAAKITYLLSKSFDLFGLIDSGLAIEKEPVQGE